MLTGLIEGSSGPEAWFANAAKGERLALGVRGRLGEVELLAVGRDAAEFRLGEERFVVRVGWRMDQRQPVPEAAPQQ